MFQNYLKIALRHLRRERLYSVINLAGLSVGAAVVILIFLFVRDEWTFDGFHAKGDRIYRMWVKEHYQGEVFFNTVTPFILGPTLEEELPEVEQVVQYFTFSDMVKQGDFSDQEQIHIISPSFLQVFDFPLLEGDPATALGGLRQVLITPATAEKYFGKQPALGRSLTLTIGGRPEPFQVSGIIAAAPANSSLRYDLLIPFENAKELTSERGRLSWTNVSPETYVLLRKGVDADVLTGKLATLIDAKVADIYKPGEYQAGFQPLRDIHLNNDFPPGIAPVSDWRYPYILAAVAGLILLLATINFVTLAVGRSVSRAREVGVRKVSGATRRQLMQQFWSEALVSSCLAVGAGVLLAEAALPLFNSLAGKQLTMNYGLPGVVACAGLALLLGLLAGVYPALVISGFAPIRALRGLASRAGSEKHIILRSLVGFQFVLSITLIGCTLLMQQQLRFLQNKNLGYHQEQVLILPYQAAPAPGQRFTDVVADGEQRAGLLRQELQGKPGITGLTTSSHAFGTPGWTRVGYTDPAGDQFRRFYLLDVDYNYFDLMGIDFAAGRPFSESVGTDRTSGVIINEAFARAYGLDLKADQLLPAPFEQFTVVGITRDFNFAPLYSPVEPLLMAIDPFPVMQICSDMTSSESPTPKIAIRLAAGNLPAAVDEVKAAWARVAPDQAFVPYFLADAVDRQYRAEQRLGHILILATILAVFIACLGLFGIATLSTARRTKEIGIRKVMGATVLDIVLLLNQGFTRLVLLASVLAIPLAWLLMHRWMADFAYRVGVRPLTLAAAAVAALVIAWLAVSYQSLRAARRNPVESLRYE